MLSPVPGSPAESVATSPMDYYKQTKERFGALAFDDAAMTWSPSVSRPSKRNRVEVGERRTPQSIASTATTHSEEDDMSDDGRRSLDGVAMRLPVEPGTPPLRQHRVPVVEAAQPVLNPFAPNDELLSRCESFDGRSSEDATVIAAVAARAVTRRGATGRFEADFRVVKNIGKGSFGTVYKVQSRLDGVFYAVKSTRAQFKGQAHRDRMLAEVYALAALSTIDHDGSKYIVRYYQAWIEDERLFIQTELCDGSLEKHISKGRFAKKDIWTFLRQLLLALQLLHDRGLVHLDIKPGNVFVVVKQNAPIYKLGDFGLVARANSKGDVVEGDSRYMSKELLQDDVTGFDLTKCDVFSLGAAAYEIARGTPLAPNGDDWHAVRNGPPSLAPTIPADLDATLAVMMRPVPSARPSATELLAHENLQSEVQQLHKQLQKERNHVDQFRQQLLNLTGLHQQRLSRSNTWT